MGKPLIVAVDTDPSSVELLEQELRKRYCPDYQVVCERSTAAALTTLSHARGDSVALVVAALSMPDPAVEVLARAHALHPSALRIVVFPWGDRAAGEATTQAWTLGQVDDWITAPTGPSDEHFHQGISAFLYAWAARHRAGPEAIQIVGEQWSPRSHQIRDLLTRNGVPFGFHDPDSDAGRALLAPVGTGADRLPVLITLDNRLLVDPSNAEIATALGVRTAPAHAKYDVVIVGGGPAGLATAVYAASEGLHTAVLEHEALGGQAGSSSLIRNYLGFPRGVRGTELAARAVQQAVMFGTHIVFGRATGIRTEEGEHVVTLDNGTDVAAHAVIIATGVTYRRLNAPGVDSLTGLGVFYGAAASEAAAMTGQQVYVAGGANSAAQAALHLAGHAAHVTLLVRGTTLRHSMSHYLQSQLQATTNIEIRYRTEVAEARGEGRLTQLVLRTAGTTHTTIVPAAALFVMIGAQPHTGWLPHAIQRDQWGYVRTGPDVQPQRLTRATLPFETSMPGIFAVGDVRSGSIKRVASAVGDGAVAVRLVHDHLAQLSAHPGR